MERLLLMNYIVLLSSVQYVITQKPFFIPQTKVPYYISIISPNITGDEISNINNHQILNDVKKDMHNIQNEKIKLDTTNWETNFLRREHHSIRKRHVLFQLPTEVPYSSITPDGQANNINIANIRTLQNIDQLNIKEKSDLKPINSFDYTTRGSFNDSHNSNLNFETSNTYKNLNIQPSKTENIEQNFNNEKLKYNKSIMDKGEEDSTSLDIENVTDRYRESFITNGTYNSSLQSAIDVQQENMETEKKYFDNKLTNMKSQPQTRSKTQNRQRLIDVRVHYNPISNITRKYNATLENRMQAESAKYSFSSSFKNSINDNENSRSEVRDGLKLTGHYSYSDGYYKRTVNYVADENGYRVIKEDVEKIGNGPVENIDGSATVNTVINNRNPLSYSISGSEFLKKRTKSPIFTNTQENRIHKKTSDIRK